MIGTLALLILLAAGGLAVWLIWERMRILVPAEAMWPLGPWFVRGVGGGIAMAVLFNSGWLLGMPPLLSPDLSFGSALLVSAWYLVTWWAAVTMLWLLATVAPHVREQASLVGLALGWGAVALVPVVLIWILLGSAGWGLSLALWLGFICHGWCAVGSARRSPAYSAAVGKLKLGHVEEAEWAVIGQLEKFPEDYRGWMLLAEIYAEHYEDMAAAERTVLQLCAQPNINWVEVSEALNRLADWQLKRAGDVEGARFALEELCRRMPGTHMARMAGHRLERLPASADEWQRQRAGRTVKLPKTPVAMRRRPERSEEA